MLIHLGFEMSDLNKRFCYGLRFLKTLCLPIVFVVATNSLSAQQISAVSVTSVGVGINIDEATTRALVRAVSQVNGESVASSMRLSSATQETAKSNPDGSISATFNDSESLKQEIESKTKGVVKSWRMISSKSLPTREVEVTITSEIFILKRSKQLDRLKIAVVGGQRGDTEFAQLVQSYLINDLVTSRKFAVMDRKNVAVIQQQLSKIRANKGAIEDQVRLSAELAPDLLAILSTELVGKGTARQRVVVSLEIVDYATRQVKFSEKRSRLVKAESYSRIDMMAKGVSKGLYRTVLQTAFPPTVVGVEDGVFTIAQGSDFFAKGDKIILRRMGKPIRDPHTGEFLSRGFQDIAEGQIIFSDLRISQARLSAQVRAGASDFVSGDLQVFRKDQELGDLFSLGDSEGQSGEGGKRKGLFITGSDEDD
jgi:ribosomal protein L12E/L44/L45/RPP1/RPP2